MQTTYESEITIEKNDFSGLTGNVRLHLSLRLRDGILLRVDVLAEKVKWLASDPENDFNADVFEVQGDIVIERGWIKVFGKLYAVAAEDITAEIRDEVTEAAQFFIEELPRESDDDREPEFDD
jgi:hypothetical protein